MLSDTVLKRDQPTWIYLAQWLEIKTLKNIGNYQGRYSVKLCTRKIVYTAEATGPCYILHDRYIRVYVNKQLYI